MVTAATRIEALRRRREAVGLRQEDLAKKMLVTLSSVNRWENGANPPHEFILRGWEQVILEAEQEKIRSLKAGR